MRRETEEEEDWGVSQPGTDSREQTRTQFDL